ncbi:hypothetical protein PMJ10TS2_55130 [Paenibacillus melissococcoides]
MFEANYSFIFGAGSDVERLRRHLGRHRADVDIFQRGRLQKHINVRSKILLITG